MFGFNDAAGASSYALQERVGAPVRRILVGWNEVQPGPTTWTWGQTDAAYAGMLRAHLRPLFVLVAAPCWAHPRVPCDGGQTGAFGPDPAFDGAWAAFVRAVVVRYPRAVGIEVWNEENVPTEFLPYPSPARYTQLLKAAYRAVKGVNRGLPVVSGGLFASAVSQDDAISDSEFLRGMYAAGAKGFLDGIGIHPYPVAARTDGTSAHYDPAVMEQTLSRIRAVRALAHDTHTPLWVTETGVPTVAYPGSPAPASDQEQATYLVAMAHALERDGDVRAVIVHQLIDDASQLASLPGHEPGFGVFRADGRPKPAACALSAAFHGTLRC